MKKLLGDSSESGRIQLGGPDIPIGPLTALVGFAGGAAVARAGGRGYRGTAQTASGTRPVPWKLRKPEL